MNRLRTLVHNERGVALVMALTILVTLTGLVLALLSVSAFEPQISRNHVDGVQARQVAEAGIEYAYKTLTTNYNTWNNFLAGATCTTGAVIGVADTTLPGLTSAHGTFTVRVRNDCKANDNKITGVVVEGGGNATNDTNNILILTSTGTIGNATRTITVAISKIDFNITGALSFPGFQSDVNFSGSAFTIDGRSYTMNDSVGNPSQLDAPNGNYVAPVYGISVNGGLPGNELLIETALQNNQQNVVRGKDETAALPWTQGANTVNTDPTQTSLSITNFVNHMKKYADISYAPPTGTGYAIQNVGSTCTNTAADATNNACWGTESRPKIVYVNGSLPNPASQITSLSVSGTSVGTGILIVENGNFEISGNFRWNGPIIVTGNNVGIRYLGGGFQNVYGTAIVNELNNNEAPNLEGEVTGNASLLFSRHAIDVVRQALINRFVKTYSWSDQ